MMHDGKAGESGWLLCSTEPGLQSSLLSFLVSLFPTGEHQRQLGMFQNTPLDFSIDNQQLKLSLLLSTASEEH